MPTELRRVVTPHALRHTAAMILLASGAADVGTVKNILGHESRAPPPASTSTPTPRPWHAPCATIRSRSLRAEFLV